MLSRSYSHFQHGSESLQVHYTTIEIKYMCPALSYGLRREHHGRFNLFPFFFTHQDVQYLHNKQKWRAYSEYVSHCL